MKKKIAKIFLFGLGGILLVATIIFLIFAFIGIAKTSSFLTATFVYLAIIAFFTMFIWSIDQVSK